MKRFRDWWQHVVGMTGQVAAGMPQIVVVAYLARRSSLEMAGLFTVAVGLAAAAYTAALWGFVPHLVLDRLRRFSAWTYLSARLFALALMSIVIAAGSRIYFPEIATSLVLAVIAFRATDALIDLHFGLTQVWDGAEAAIKLSARLHLYKLALMVLMLLVLDPLALAGPSQIILASAVACLAGTVVYVVSQPRLWRTASDPSTPAVRLFGQAFWLASAAILCSVVTNMPRISVPHFYSGEQLGVVGIALTISTFFGMALYTTWIRHFPGLAVRSSRGDIASLVREIAILCGLFGIAAIWPLPQLLAQVFDYDLPGYGGQVRSILLAAVVFFGGMGLANLYKLSRHQWLESAVYLSTLGLIVGLRMADPGWASLPFLLTVAGTAMAALSLPALVMRREFRADAGHAVG